MSKYLNPPEENNPDWFKDLEMHGIDPYSKNPYSINKTKSERLEQALRDLEAKSTKIVFFYVCQNCGWRSDKYDDFQLMGTTVRECSKCHGEDLNCDITWKRL